MADPANQRPNVDQSEANGGPSEDHGPGESSSESQVEASSSTSQPTNKCASCGAPEADPEKPLKPCAKCQRVRYCSRDCQKKDFKVHKKICAAAAQIYAQNANLKPAAPRVPKKEGHRGGLQKWQFDT
ncbi:hypothetical protein NA56DRAFT_647832 [Hyaloscypha hepaticicola]|uniref:MYND-type domain-containing protein n=1 Tax=Hyaloscypha hepaticicola TaxID=2082293 RepID=A0A2J6PXB0_9HELO|nr:hypothetical protein NA56DRAFT_647832 [Hyaloscypha hepaticicola]